MSKKKAYLFHLSGVKPDEIDKQYGFKSPHTAMLAEKYIPHQSTRISDLQHFTQNITVVDELKNAHNARVSMSQQANLSQAHCYWDRHPLPVATTPVFCPVDRKQTPRIKTYVSHINGKPYKIQDSMQLSEHHEYFVDGVFCSVECCLAFIYDQQHNPLYQQSELYLREIYTLKDQKCAPHWRLLSAYGGNLSIEEFRNSFANTTYTPDGTIFNPLCFVFRENYHL